MQNTVEIYTELLSLIKQNWSALPDKPDENPETALHALWNVAAGNAPLVGAVELGNLPDLDEASLETLHGLVEQLCASVPLAYLVGKVKFMNLGLLSGPGAMIPRKETEILGKAVVEVAHQLVRTQGKALVVDLCTGSGTLALAVATAEPGCLVYGGDISSEAVELARRNADLLGVSERVTFYAGDLFEPFRTPQFLGQVDLIICNPPYIASSHVDQMPYEIRGFEPRLAFDGGPFGIQILARLIREAPQFAHPGTWLCFEVGLGQGRALTNVLNKAGRYSAPEFLYDSSGEIRALKTSINAAAA